jgi:hypothetical protein
MVSLLWFEQKPRTPESSKRYVTFVQSVYPINVVGRIDSFHL